MHVHSFAELCLTFCDSVDHSPTGLLCLWGSPGKNNGVGDHFLLQGISSTQGWSPDVLCLVHWQVDSLSLVPPGKPSCACQASNKIKYLGKVKCLKPLILTAAFKNVFSKNNSLLFSFWRNK